MDTDLDDDDDEEQQAGEDDDDKEDEDDAGSAQTEGKGGKVAAEHKFSSVQRVETNRQKIVDAGRKLKTLRQKKDEQKKKRSDAFYFIDTQTAVDHRAHWEHLDVHNGGVVTDEAESDENAEPVVKVSKITKGNKIESNSSSVSER